MYLAPLKQSAADLSLRPLLEFPLYEVLLAKAEILLTILLAPVTTQKGLRKGLSPLTLHTEVALNNAAAHRARRECQQAVPLSVLARGLILPPNANPFAVVSPMNKINGTSWLSTKMNNRVIHFDLPNSSRSRVLAFERCSPLGVSAFHLLHPLPPRFFKLALSNSWSFRTWGLCRR